MDLFDWKAFRDSEITDGRIFLSLFAKALEISLHKILQGAIRRYSVTRVGLLTFGIRVINVRFMEGGI